LWTRPGVWLTLFFVAVALLSRVWTPEPPARMRMALRLRPPLGGGGLLGTDPLGHDILSMLMAGAWNSLTIALAAIGLGLVAGVGLGLAAASLRGWSAEAILRLADVVFAFPALVSAIMIGALLGTGASTAVLAIGLFAVPVFTRLTYAGALGILARDFCLAARAAGHGRLSIAIRHVLPNIAGALAVQATLQIGLAILIEAGLSFLGLGVRPPEPSWGRMLSEAQTYLSQAPWMAIAPGVTIALTVLGLNLLGDALRDRLDPRSEPRP
jgi:peptide/nickel transport system permease protein